MQSITSPKTDTLSFLDQCTFVCFKYIVRYGSMDIHSPLSDATESLRELCRSSAEKAAEFGEDNELLPLVYSAHHLSWVASRATFDSLRLNECLNTLRSFLEQDVFGECADVFVRPPVDSMEKVALLAHLIYKTAEIHGKTAIGPVVEIGVQYMRRAIADFVNSSGGWKGIAVLAHGEGHEDLSSSLVVVNADEVKDLDSVIAGSQRLGEQVFLSRGQQPLSPLGSPPFSVPSSINTDDDRDSLATPPEIIEKLLISESCIDAMTQDELVKLSQDKIGSLSSDYAKEASGIETPAIPIESKVPQLATAKVSNYEECEIKSKIRESKQHTQPEESIFRSYLPHLSVGFAAAAAIASLFVLKKNS